jgi:hypothetical protein
MWHHEIVRQERPELELVPIGLARSGQNPIDTKTTAEKEAFAWLIGQLKFERTLEVLRTRGSAPERQQRVAA